MAGEEGRTVEGGRMVRKEGGRAVREEGRTEGDSSDLPTDGTDVLLLYKWLEKEKEGVLML